MHPVSQSFALCLKSDLNAFCRSPVVCFGLSLINILSSVVYFKFDKCILSVFGRVI